MNVEKARFLADFLVQEITHQIFLEIRLLMFRYRYRILAFVAVMVSGTVRVLNGTRYRQYLIATSRCHISVDGCLYCVLLRFLILIYANEKK